MTRVSINSRVGIACLFAFIATFGMASFVQAQETTEKPKEGSIVAGAKEINLDQLQNSLSLRYKRFEKTLLKLAEYTRKTDPDRADLLLRAIGKSRESRVNPQMEMIVSLLNTKQFGEALIARMS